MKRKVRIGMGLVLIICLIVAAACSGSGETNVSNDNGAASTSAADVDSKDSDRIYDISFMNYAYGIFPPTQGPAIDMIKEKFNANVSAQFIKATDFPDKLSVLMASGSMPDVVQMLSNGQNFIDWAKQGAYLPLDEYIDQYPTLQMVPDVIYRQLTVDGKIYGIPTFQPTYDANIMIRKDWLDNLGLSMPTNYQQLLDVAIAFTKDDPDQNGVDDTYGFALAADINPSVHAGFYWSPNAWYFKDEDGNYIPGIIGPGRKEVIQTLHDAYAQGAVTKDFVVLNHSELNMEFFKGKAGILNGNPQGGGENEFMALWNQFPEAEPYPVPWFVDPDGNQGGLNGSGFFGFVVLSSTLKDDPDKVHKILEMMDYGRTFIPLAERNPQNEHYDWLFGGEGTGYEMVDGLPVLIAGAEGSTPIQYMMQRHEYWKPWAPSNEAMGSKQ